MTSVAVRLQDLDEKAQVLALIALALGRSSSGCVQPRDIDELLWGLGIPAPKKTSNVFLALEREQFVTRRRATRGCWVLTPTGRDRALEQFRVAELQALEALLAGGAGSLLGGTHHAEIPSELAPPELIPRLQHFLAAHPFETNVFAMTRFPSDGEALSDVLTVAIGSAREVCAQHGMTMHLALDRAIHDDLLSNVMAHIWASRYGIAFFEDRAGEGLNYNLTIEVGAMLLAGRRCALLKDKTVDRLPTDLTGRIYIEIDLDNPGGVRQAMHRWIAHDIALGVCEDKECN